MSHKRGFLSGLLTVLALAVFGLGASVAEAATLYITEYASGVTPIGSTEAQIVPTPSIAVQTVSVNDIATISAGFNTKTKIVSLICDIGCSISIGTNPTATTSTTLLQQGVTYLFGVSSGQKISTISNPAGNTSSGSPSGTQDV